MLEVDRSLDKNKISDFLELITDPFHKEFYSIIVKHTRYIYHLKRCMIKSDKL